MRSTLGLDTTDYEPAATDDTRKHGQNVDPHTLHTIVTGTVLRAEPRAAAAALRAAALDLSFVEGQSVATGHLEAIARAWDAYAEELPLEPKAS